MNIIVVYTAIIVKPPFLEYFNVLFTSILFERFLFELSQLEHRVDINDILVILFSMIHENVFDRELVVSHSISPYFLSGFNKLIVNIRLYFPLLRFIPTMVGIVIEYISSQSILNGAGVAFRVINH